MSAQEKHKEEEQQEQQNFSADVSRLLNIVAHALYTNQDVFLRELISNAADACDRLRYDSIASPDLIKDNPNFRICTYKDSTNRTVTVVDNGVGMDKHELIENLGIIAKSGTAALTEKMKEAGDDADKLKLIGQFGVGFYASFMVAHKIQVVSRKAGQDAIWLWESDGKSNFIIREANEMEAARLDGQRGTAITLDIKDEACEFLLDQKIQSTIKEYSDHISVPIFLGAPTEVAKNKDAEPINSTSALWMRPKADISEKDYLDFYNHISSNIDEPLMTSHWKAEGAIEFTSLLYIPTQKPWDLFDPGRKNSVKLYVRRIFITDEIDSLMYPWLRFMRGVIDSEDLPLNISRETLQYNLTIEKIRSAVARRILGDLDKLSRNDPPAFTLFWGQFGSALKEGLYDAPVHREALLKVCRFYSTYEDGEKFVTLADYVSRMKGGQEEIYYISGDSLKSIKNSPQAEGFKARGIEVLYLTDTIDDFWLQSVLDYKGKTFKSITKGDIDLDKIVSGDKPNDDDKEKSQNTEKNDESINTLITTFQSILEKHVHNIRPSKRLTESAVCLVAPDEAVDMHMEQVLKVHQKYQSNTKPILEINTQHDLIKTLAQSCMDGNDVSDAAFLLLDQAKIIQGQSIDDMSAFARRMSNFMNKAI
ncbi:MAG: molecular chaperone HtpG [Zetaproteobacteria bacterium]|nr:MAG: molecular chaperone HtpG [Zetaproteobacteria bacterium]